MVKQIRTGWQGYVPSNFIAQIGSLEAEPWFFDKTSRNEAERLLKHKENSHGSFLIRRAENPSRNHEFSISILKREGISHFRILRTAEGRFRILQTEHFDKLQDLVNNYLRQRRRDLSIIKPCIRIEKPATMGLGVDQWEIEKSCLVQNRVLGSGNFGRVWQGVWNGKVKVAVKEMKPGSMDKNDFLQEAEIMKPLNHPKLIKLLAISSREEPILIVLELMENGSLDQYLKDHAQQNKYLKEKYLINMGTQVAQGMAYLEKHRLVHRDLAARNVLVGVNNQCKVADFGLARPVQDEEEYISLGKTPIPVKWTAPEAFYGDFTSKSDVWSFGILLTEIITHGQPPYPGVKKRELLDKLKSGYRMEMSSMPLCSEKLYDIMLQCWKQRPEERPGFFAIEDKLESFFDLTYKN